jgi:acetyl-CoA acetyltransferase
MAEHTFRNRVAIVGAGVTKVVRRADVPAASLAVEASDAAIADARLSRSDIDGVACGVSLPSYAAARTALKPGYDFVNSDFLVEHMGLEPGWALDDPSFPPALAHAVFAVASGAATTVLVNRTLHNPAGRYNTMMSQEARGWDQWTAPYGFVAPSSGIAMPYMEYQQRFGARQEHMATLVLQARKNVQRISQAYWHGRELTFEEYMSSRMISEPMCLFDNDIPVDGSGAVVVTTAERARDLPHKPVYITSWAKIRNPPAYLPGTLGPLDDFYDRGHDLAKRLWDNSGWHPEDVDVVQLYDGFTPLVWFWLEVLGFCGQGEAWQFIQDGRIASDGPFPLNSGGGNQGWGRLHGVPHVLESYWQLSGRAGDRQTPNANRALSTYATPAHAIGEALLYSTDPAA